MLEREHPAAYGALQRRLEEVLERLPAEVDRPAFPRTLVLDQQGYFVLGFYHQRAADRARMREAAERRRAGAASPADAGDAELEDALEDKQAE
jgi:CRISPR-associated protein Csd1